MAQLSRKEREKRRRRNEVLDAAEELFSLRGFYETTVQDIAERAEFAVGTIYNMFENKDAIYHEIVRIRVREHMDLVKEELRTMSDPQQMLRTLIRAKFDFFDKHRQFFSIFTRVLHGGPTGCSHNLSDDGRRLYNEYMELLTDIFRAGISSGRFADHDPALFALSFEGITRMVVSNHLLKSGAGSPETDIEGVERIIFRGVLKS